MLCIISNKEKDKVLHKYGELADLKKWAKLMAKEGDKVIYFREDNDSGANKLGLKYESNGKGLFGRLFDRRR